MANTLLEVFSQQQSMLQILSSCEAALKTCSDKCRRIIPNGSNALFQNSVCISRCKIQTLKSTLMTLLKMKQTSQDPLINTKIMYLQMRISKEIQKLKTYRTNLVRRQSKTPMAQSMKLSPLSPLTDKG